MIVCRYAIVNTKTLTTIAMATISSTEVNPPSETGRVPRELIGVVDERITYPRAPHSVRRERSGSYAAAHRIDGRERCQEMSRDERHGPKNAARVGDAILPAKAHERRNS